MHWSLLQPQMCPNTSMPSNPPLSQPFTSLPLSTKGDMAIDDSGEENMQLEDDLMAVASPSSPPQNLIKGSNPNPADNANDRPLDLTHAVEDHPMQAASLFPAPDIEDDEGQAVLFCPLSDLNRSEQV